MVSEVAGVRVGHWTDQGAGTGCTVVLPPPGTVGGVEVRGGGPATREADLLGPLASVQDVTALMLSGGSAYGLDAAAGVVRWCEERGLGHDTGAARVPIVPAACIYDLGIAADGPRPGPDHGYAACEAAAEGPHAVGSVGAGTGATVGKLRGQDGWCKGGLGAASRRLYDGTVVAALAVVNAWGDVLAEDGTVLAGAFDPGEGFLCASPAGARGAAGAPAPGGAGEHDAGLRRHRRRPPQGRLLDRRAHGPGRGGAGGLADPHAARRRRGLLPGHGRAAGQHLRLRRGGRRGRGGGDPRRRAQRRRGARRADRGGAGRVPGRVASFATPARRTPTHMPDITGPLVNFATDQVGSYGLLAVFLLMILESALIPVPSEAIMLYGGFLVSRGDESLTLMIGAGVLGNVIGSWIAYWIGRSKGREWALRWHWLHITPQRLDSADRWFARYGDWAVLLSRCLPIVRTFISLPAGIARMPFWRFTLFTLIGCIPWVTALALAGRAVGDNWEDLQSQLHYLDYALVVAIVGGVVWLVVRHRRRRRAPAAPQAEPEAAPEAEVEA